MKKAALFRNDIDDFSDMGPLFIDGDSFTIGRAPGADLSINDSALAEKHAVIKRSGDDYMIRPLSADNTVVVNGARITSETALNNGDLLIFGQEDFTFLLSEGDGDNYHFSHSTSSSSGFTNDFFERNHQRMFEQVERSMDRIDSMMDSFHDRFFHTANTIAGSGKPRRIEPGESPRRGPFPDEQKREKKTITVEPIETEPELTREYESKPEAATTVKTESKAKAGPMKTANTVASAPKKPVGSGTKVMSVLVGVGTLALIGMILVIVLVSLLFDGNYAPPESEAEVNFLVAQPFMHTIYLHGENWSAQPTRSGVLTFLQLLTICLVMCMTRRFMPERMALYSFVFSRMLEEAE